MKIFLPLEKIFIISSLLQLLTSSVQGQSSTLQNEPVEHPHIHQHGHHPVNHPDDLEGNHNNGNLRHSKRGSKRSGKRYHPWNADHLHYVHGQHGKQQGRNENHQHNLEHGNGFHHQGQHSHEEQDQEERNHSEDRAVSAGSEKVAIHGSPSLSESSVSSSLSSSSFSMSSSSIRTHEAMTGKTVPLPSTKEGSMGNVEIETLQIQKSGPSETRIEMETFQDHPATNSIETNVIAVHTQYHHSD